MTTHKTEAEGAQERLAIADRLLVLSLLVAGVVLAITGDREHAGLLLAGALGALAPLGSRGGSMGLTRVLPLALGLGAAVALSGCGASLGTVGRYTCGAIDVAHRACTVAGLSPEAPCPVPLDDVPNDDAGLPARKVGGPRCSMIAPQSPTPPIFAPFTRWSPA